MEKLIIGEVRTVLWKIGWSEEFRKTPHKVGNQKSPGKIDLLRTSAGVILYPTIFIPIKEYCPHLTIPYFLDEASFFFIIYIKEPFYFFFINFRMKITPSRVFVDLKSSNVMAFISKSIVGTYDLG